MATEKQSIFIAREIGKKQFEYPTLKSIWDGQGGASLKSLARKIEKGMTNSQASTVIKWCIGEKNQFGKERKTSVVFDILIKANLIN